MPRNHNHLTRLQLPRRGQHMAQQRAARQFLQHFGDAAFHARAFASGHDDDIQGEQCGHTNSKKYVNATACAPVRVAAIAWAAA